MQANPPPGMQEAILRIDLTFASVLFSAGVSIRRMQPNMTLVINVVQIANEGFVEIVSYPTTDHVFIPLEHVALLRPL